MPAAKLFVRGALLGALTGLAVSTAYATLLIAFFLLTMLYGALTTAPSQPQDAAIMLLIGPASAGIMFICAGFIGILPGTLLGTVLGFLISLPLALLRPYLSRWGAAGLGAVIAAAVVGAIHLFLLWYDPNPSLREYLLQTILPGLLCIIAGGWVGWRLFLDALPLQDEYLKGDKVMG
jgi:hypothetical protein